MSNSRQVWFISLLEQSECSVSWISTPASCQDHSHMRLQKNDFELCGTTIWFHILTKTIFLHINILTDLYWSVNTLATGSPRAKTALIHARKWPWERELGNRNPTHRLSSAATKQSILSKRYIPNYWKSYLPIEIICRSQNYGTPEVTY